MSATQPKRRGRPPKAGPSYADLGPTIRQEAAPGAAVASVVVDYRPDPDRPQGAPVRGASVVIIYDWLHAQAMLSDSQREAADRYCVQMERASGATEWRGERIPGANGAGTPTERQVSALADLRGADEILGRDVPLVRMVIGQNAEPPDGVPVTQLRTALQRLAVWWQMD